MGIFAQFKLVFFLGSLKISFGVRGFGIRSILAEVTKPEGFVLNSINYTGVSVSEQNGGLGIRIFCRFVRIPRPLVAS